MAREDLEQVELAPGESEVAAAERRDLAPGVDDEVADEVRPGDVGAAATQQRVQPRGELGEREGLDEVVVGAGLQAPHPVVDLVAGGEDADGDVEAVRAQTPHDAHAVEVGHRHVEHDDSRRMAPDRGERLAAAVGRGHGEALEREGALEGLPDGRLVVDDEDPGLGGYRGLRRP